jgi:twitching motility protein PilT
VLNLNALLQTLADEGGSDLHLKAGSPPVIRVDTELRRLDEKPITPQQMTALADSVIPADRKDRFQTRGDCDFALSVMGLGRFRVNAFHQRGSISMAMRRVRVGGESFEDLMLPMAIRDLAEMPRGLVLVTGPTGAGKTTTLAAMVDHINKSRPVHILTIEDPIEVLHPDHVATVNQRELGIDTESYIDAMRAAMREDPDVIMIGEMRDTETVGAALAAAETGHLVLSTLHTTDAVETVNRVIDFFPQSHQHQIRVSLSGVLKGVVCQRLAPRTGGGMIPAVEVMVSNGRIVDRILDPNVTAEIHDIIAQGSSYGMQTFDQALLNLVQQDLISIPDALATASRGHDFGLMLQQAGLVEASLASA